MNQWKSSLGRLHPGIEIDTHCQNLISGFMANFDGSRKKETPSEKAQARASDEPTSFETQESSGPSGPKPQEAMKLPGGWYAIALSSEVTQKPIKLKRFNLNLVLWRAENGKIIVMEDRCPHRSAELSEGTLVTDSKFAAKKRGTCIQCPYHGLQLDQHG
ncbi:MAG: Rieske 2Fe-2S domain-containing protein, partial [Bdellovibrionia bacterium]